jgi:hypothetical protein
MPDVWQRIGSVSEPCESWQRVVTPPTFGVEQWQRRVATPPSQIEPWQRMSSVTTDIGEVWKMRLIS